jgi:UDP-galactopyranose mutase
MLTRVGVPVESEVEPSASGPQPTTMICFSHLRWNFVFQRPQHLMSRFAREMDVIYWEEPVDIPARETAFLQVREADDAANVRIVVPHLPEGMPEAAREAALKRLLDAKLAAIRGPVIAWYYTPMMLPFSRHIEADAVVFDAMDELSKFKFAPEHLLDLEQELIERADIVFTGGSSLYEAKKDRHANVHCFPSSVDRAHFAKARARTFDPADQEDLPRPRLGFYGVIDERFDVELLDKVATMRPNWSFVMVGPVVKIDPEELPKRRNIHYLGSKKYEQLPSYLAGGKPVVTTPVKDVVRHYGQLEGVRVAATAEEFAAACDKALELARDPESGWLAEADLVLSAASWDTTQARMAGLLADVLGTRTGAQSPALLVAAE